MPSVEFLGEGFTISERIGLMPLMRFAKAAKSGVDTDDLAGLTAMYDLLEQCIAPEDWQKFEEHATKQRADGEQLMGFVAEVMAVITDRPTSRPSDSSAGPSTTPASSTDASSRQVINRFESSGRPDLALMVERTVAGRRTA